MRYPIFLFLTIILFSCGGKESKAPEFVTSELTEFISDTLYLEKDEFTKNLPAGFTYLEERDSSFLYTWSEKRLLKYDYPSGKLVSSTNFTVEGPDGIGSFISGSLITEDGLFFISDQKNITHADFEGKVVDRFPLPSVPEERLAVNFSTMNGNEMTYDVASKVLVISDVPFILKEPNMSYQDWIWKLDTRTGKFEPVDFVYPDIYKDYYDDIELGKFSHTLVQNRHLISFPASDSLLVIAGDSSYWVDGSSSKVLTFEKGTTEEIGEFIVFHPNLESSRFKWTLWDPYQKKLLRYVDIQTKKSEEEKLTNESSFIVLDGQYRKVAELFFDNRKILPSGFATPNGFYLKLAEQESDDREGYVRIKLDL
jgi:hypothetical protein